MRFTTLIVFGPTSLLAIGMFMFVRCVYSSLGSTSMGDTRLIILAARLWDRVTDPVIC